jgi:prolyl 4-hydroxylase
MTQTAEKLANPPTADWPFDAWGTARPELNFVREYYLSDVSVCDKLVDMFKTCRELGLTQPGFTGRFQVNKAVKDSEDLAVERLPKNHPKLPSPDKSGYNDVMRQFTAFIPRYYKDTSAGWAQPVAFKVLPHFQYYKPGGGYHAWHVDAFGDVVDRHLVFLLYLNDVPGGGTSFQLQRYTCEAKKGKVLMFPANFSYPHRSQISMTHEKYILTGWACAAPGMGPR